MKTTKGGGVDILLEKTLPNVPRGTQKGLLRYINLTLRWNRSVNLTGPSDPRLFLERHVLDCAAALDSMPKLGALIDIGSGAGLPGLVWALLDPNREFVLVEPQKKRWAFLHRAVAELRLPNVRLLSQSFESISIDPPRPNLLVSRGTWPPAQLLALAQASNYPWKSWWVFSSENLHLEYLKLASAYHIKGKLLTYRKFNGDLGYLTQLDPGN